MIGLVDVDSKIPNLALMKLSAYFKNLKYKVKLVGPVFADQCDEVFASKVFDYTELPALPENTVVGGPGYSLDTRLDDSIEMMYPDYFLYGCNYAIGYTSRGCNRNCPFCVVPRKEGKFHPVCDIYQFWNGQDRIRLLDNSLNTDEEHFERILNQLIEHRIRVDFTQGLDVRYLTDKQAFLLSRVKLWKRIHFAWDLMPTEKAVRKGVEILGKYHLKSKSTFYVLVGFNTTQEEDLYRVETLKNLGVDPFVMPYNKFDQYQKDFARWCNRKNLLYSVKWEEYTKGYKKVKYKRGIFF